MRGYTSIEVKNCDEMGRSPITTTFTFHRDNTLELANEWVDVFNNILTVMGFCCQVEISEHDDFCSDGPNGDDD